MAKSYRNQPYPQINIIFNSERSKYINSTSPIQFKDKKFPYIPILYNQYIMISDLILLWEFGHLKEKLNIQGYFQFVSMIKEFIRYQQNKQTILNQCLILNMEKYSIVSKFVLNVNYPSIMEQYNELLPKIQQFLDLDKGKELNIVLNSAFSIYSQLNIPLQKMQQFKDNDLMGCIQKRFFMKQYLKQQNKNEEKYLGYFQEINEELKKLKNQQQYQIIDLLIEADAETLEQVYYCVKNQQALQFKFLPQGQRIISDLELNNYFLASLQITDQIISDQNVLEEFIKKNDKNQYILDTFNEILKDLEGYQITFQDNSNQQDKSFIKFKDALVNQLKIKYWIFQVELTQYNEDHKLNDEINKIFNQYYKSICLKLPFNNLLEQLIQIILNCDKIEGIVERILELKIQNINKYVLNHIEKYNLVDIDKKLNQLFQKKRQKYLKKLKDQPLTLQQVDIVIDYCNKTSTIIEMENQNAIVDFTNANQLQILQNYLSPLFPNYDNLSSDEQFLPELFKQTNKFCPDLSILQSTQLLIYYQKLYYMKPKKETYEIVQKQQQQQKDIIQLNFLDYEKLDIQKVIQQHQNIDQLPSVQYENRIWNQFHNQLISECTKCLDQIVKKKRNEKFNQQKKKLQNIYEECFLIPFEWVETILKNSYEEMKDEQTMKKIDCFFIEVQEDEENHLKTLQEYVELDNDVIKNRNRQIKEYFHSCGKRNYENIEKLKEDIKSEIETIRQQQFKKFYEIKKSIEQIHGAYIKQCQEIFKQPPIPFQKCKLDKQTQQNDLIDINNKIMSFYGKQLINHLKYQLEQ